MIDRRQAAVDHLTSLLERDVISLEQFQPFVDRVLATTTDADLGMVLAALPTGPPLVIRCRSGVINERPLHVAAATEIICESGVVKVDLSRASFDHLDVDLDIECDTGVLQVVLPRDVTIEIADHEGSGGVFRNRTRGTPPETGVPRVHVHVRNGGGVIKLRHPRRWLRRRS